MDKKIKKQKKMGYDESKWDGVWLFIKRYYRRITFFPFCCAFLYLHFFSFDLVYGIPVHTLIMQAFQALTFVWMTFEAFERHIEDASRTSIVALAHNAEMGATVGTK